MLADSHSLWFVEIPTVDSLFRPDVYICPGQHEERFSDVVTTFQSEDQSEVLGSLSVVISWVLGLRGVYKYSQLSKKKGCFYRRKLTTAGVTAKHEADVSTDLSRCVGARTGEGDRPARSVLGSGVDSAVPLVMAGPHHVLSQPGLRAVLVVAGTDLVD